MASKAVVKKVLEKVWLKFPKTRPAKEEFVKELSALWEKGYSSFPDMVLLEAANKFYFETTVLFDNRCPYASIREIAELLFKPKRLETQHGICTLTPEQREKNLANLRKLQEKIKEISKKKELPQEEFEKRRKEQIEKLNANSR